MDSEELFERLEKFFPKNLDLMRHLAINACWEFIIKGKSIDNYDVKLIFYLYKKSENKLIMSEEYPTDITPDLTLFFTEEAILNLVQGNPNAGKYFERYREFMKDTRPEFHVDSKINKSRLKLWQVGYKKWQNDFNF